MAFGWMMQTPGWNQMLTGAEQSVLAVSKMDFFCSAGLVGVSYPLAGSSVDCC
jgi:hypothetical protein